MADSSELGQEPGSPAENRHTSFYNLPPSQSGSSIFQDTEMARDEVREACVTTLSMDAVSNAIVPLMLAI
jgi:hypothetical protein